MNWCGRSIFKNNLNKYGYAAPLGVAETIRTHNAIVQKIKLVTRIKSHWISLDEGYELIRRKWKCMLNVIIGYCTPIDSANKIDSANLKVPNIGGMTGRKIMNYSLKSQWWCFRHRLFLMRYLKFPKSSCYKIKKNNTVSTTYL